MPTPTVGDLYARQLFSFPVPVVQKLVLHATEPESVLKDLDSLFSGSSSSMSFDTPLITLVLLLVRHRLPDSPTPALDYAWATKGSNASRQDMEVFWERERRSPGAGQATLGVKAAGGEGEGLGPSPLPKRIHADLPPTSTTDLPHRVSDKPDSEPTPDSPASTSSNFSVAPVDVRRIQALDDADMSIRASSRPSPSPSNTTPSQPQRKTSLSVDYPHPSNGNKRGSISGSARKVSSSSSSGGGGGKEEQEDAFRVAMKKRMDESKEAAERRVFVQL